MKRVILKLTLLAILLIASTAVQAQSLKDLFNKDNIDKITDAITGNKSFDITGTWNHTGAAIAFESDKLLKLITFLSSKSSNATLQAISSLADSYDGMMLGFSIEKVQQ